jgi:hypothetical protein
MYAHHMLPETVGPSTHHKSLQKWSPKFIPHSSQNIMLAAVITLLPLCSLRFLQEHLIFINRKSGILNFHVLQAWYQYFNFARLTINRELITGLATTP